MQARKTLMIKPDLHRSLKLIAFQRGMLMEALADQLLRAGLELGPASKPQKKATSRSRKK